MYSFIPKTATDVEKRKGKIRAQYVTKVFLLSKKPHALDAITLVDI